MACCGCCAPVPPGTISRRAIRLTKRVIIAFNSGSGAAGCSAYYNDWPKTCEIEANSISPRPSSTPASARRKKGLRHRLPVAIHVAPASPHEVTLVDATLAARFLKELPTRLIGDRAYDSDRLDQHLATDYAIELIAPHNPTRRS